MAESHVLLGRIASLLCTALLGGSAARGAEPADGRWVVPLTRPAMKQMIEDVKVRTPRIPLPELSESDRAELGENADSYESMLRYSYTPWADRRRGPRGAAREQDPAMTLDYAFKTQLFWIVSRVNNCPYCIGHQESKLLSAGLSEDEIASLDGDWSGHTAAERAAFSLARKLSHQPHELTDADIDALRPHFSDLQILEMVLSVSRNNISNRWKEGIGVPQRADEGGYSRNTEDPALPRGTYLTPTSPEFLTALTATAPVAFDAHGQPTTATVCDRPALESRAEVEAALTAAQKRSARLPLVDEATARAVLGEHAPSGAVPQWARLLANFPREGVQHYATVAAAEELSDLSPTLRAQLSWIIARQDRAWYATGESLRRLRELGEPDDRIYALDADWSGFSGREQALFTLAKNLAASPVVLTDDEVRTAVELAGPRDVVQTIHYTTTRCFFNRVTEAAGLPIEP